MAHICRQCLGRRIHCTPEDPACKECVKAGLVCSGFNYSLEHPGLNLLPPRPPTQPQENLNSGTIQSPFASQGQIDYQRVPLSQSAATNQGNAADQPIHPSMAAAAAAASQTQGGYQAPFQAIPIPQAPIPSIIPMIEEPGWERRTPCERRLIWLFSNQLLPIIANDTQDAWRDRVLPLAKTDDLIMTAIAFLYSSCLEVASINSFARQYLDRFRALMVERTQQDGFDTDGNYRAVIALLVVLVSQVGKFPSPFEGIRKMLLKKLATVIVGLPEPYHESINLFILPELRRLREKRSRIEEARAVQGSWCR
ncbi:hypothetical protein LZL87_008622 [Fusarium oxysporum]|nr:hypothetical protein LZL87_008622 [Fusarium oxysporum]